jgi:hypothetical protein
MRPQTKPSTHARTTARPHDRTHTRSALNAAALQSIAPHHTVSQWQRSAVQSSPTQARKTSVGEPERLGSRALALAETISPLACRASYICGRCPGFSYGTHCDNFAAHRCDRPLLIRRRASVCHRVYMVLFFLKIYIIIINYSMVRTPVAIAQPLVATPVSCDPCPVHALVAHMDMHYLARAYASTRALGPD